MNLDYSRNEKFFGFLMFYMVWAIGFVIIVWQTQTLHYPMATSITAGFVPLVIRLIFDANKIHRVVTGRFISFVK